MRNLILSVVALVGVAACSGSTSTPDSGSTPVDAGTASACGQPGMTGNSLGVGKYCQQISDCTGDTICSAIVNDPAKPERNTFVCVLPCDPCTDPAGFCGANASCVCDEDLGGCGCFPDTCSAFAAQVGMPKVCRDAGMPADAGENDGGQVTDAGDMSDAGDMTDAG